MASTTDLVPAAEPPATTLIKTDVLGRMHRTREQRERILDEYERSGLSGWKFATLCGVKYQTFATWLQRRKRQRNAYPKRQPQRKSARVQWLEASVQPASLATATGLLLQLPCGIRAQVSRPVLRSNASRSKPWQAYPAGSIAAGGRASGPGFLDRLVRPRTSPPRKPGSRPCLRR